MDDGGYKYAGFWLRFLASAIDLVIMGLFGRLVFGSEVADVNVLGYGVSADITYSGWKALIPIVYVIGSWIWLSATPGKLILGLRITDMDGNKLSWKNAAVRFFAYIPSMMVFFAGFISVAFDERKQGWHDKIAKTFVLKKNITAEVKTQESI